MALFWVALGLIVVPIFLGKYQASGSVFDLFFLLFGLTVIVFEGWKVLAG